MKRNDDTVGFDMPEEFRPGWVSVIVPIWNRARLLPATLDSILRQSYRPLEVILVDDGSDDGSKSIMEEFKIRSVTADLNVVSLYQSNQGASVARSAGLEASSGEFIQFLDSDDLLHPEKIRLQVDAFGDPELDFVWSPSIYFDGLPDWGATPDIGTRSAAHSICEYIVGFIRKSLWRTESGLYRRHLCQQVGPWKGIAMFQDWEYNIRMLSCQPKIRFVGGTVSGARVHGEGRIGDQWRNGKGLHGALEAVQSAEDCTSSLCGGLEEWRTEVLARYREIREQAIKCGRSEVAASAEADIQRFSEQAGRKKKPDH